MQYSVKTKLKYFMGDEFSDGGYDVKLYYRPKRSVSYWNRWKKFCIGKELCKAMYGEDDNLLYTKELYSQFTKKIYDEKQKILQSILAEHLKGENKDREKNILCKIEQEREYPIEI